jgi:hypothetical protein
MQKSKPQSKQAPICTTIGMKLFLFSNTIQTFLKQLFFMKTNIDQWSNKTLMQRYNKIWTKIKVKNES